MGREQRGIFHSQTRLNAPVVINGLLWLRLYGVSLPSSPIRLCAMLGALSGALHPYDFRGPATTLLCPSQARVGTGKEGSR